MEYRIYQAPVNDVGEKGRVKTKWVEQIDCDTGEVLQVNADNLEEVRTASSIAHSNRSSKMRSKNMIIEYARANDWQWFSTFTFDPQKVDSFDYKLCYQKLYQWLNNLQKRKAPDIKYLGVPEQHKSGRWHFHVLMSNVGALELVQSPVKGVYNIGGWKYGFSTATAVRSSKRVSSYITKYITKDLLEHTQGQHRYIKSRNLERASDMTYNVDPNELDKLKLDLISKGYHFKDVASPVYGHITYIQVDGNGGDNDDAI